MWDLLPNEDETMIRDSVRAFLAAELPIERLRPNAKPVDKAALRREMIELGWFGIGLPEDVGGSGLGLVEEILIQRECGRHLASPSVMASVLAAHVAYAADDSALAADLVAGKAAAALCLPSGQAFDWGQDDLLLVWNADGMGLFDAGSFAAYRAEPCLDDSLTMHVGSVDLQAARHWVDGKSAPLAMRAQILLSAALTGLSEQACDLTVDYVKVREQFGKPIATFQAVKHRCADMGVRARLAWYQTSMAALKVGAQAPDAALHAASAKLVAARAAHENGRAAIQMHGGIGFQSECDAHWFMKRAHVYDQAGGAIRELAHEVSQTASMVG